MPLKYASVSLIFNTEQIYFTSILVFNNNSVYYSVVNLLGLKLAMYQIISRRNVQDLNIFLVLNYWSALNGQLRLNVFGHQKINSGSLVDPLYICWLTSMLGIKINN